MREGEAQMRPFRGIPSIDGSQPRSSSCQGSEVRSDPKPGSATYHSHPLVASPSTRVVLPLLGGYHPQPPSLCSMHPLPCPPQEKTQTWVLGGRVLPRRPPPRRGADKTGEAELSSHPPSAPKLSVALYCPPNEPDFFRPFRAEPQLPSVFPPHPLSLPSPLARPASPASWEYGQSYHPRAIPSLEGRPIPLWGPACLCEGSLCDKKGGVPPSAGPA